MVKTKLLKILGDWQDVVDDCRATVSKPPLGKEPSIKFKKSILMSEHSPIRDIIFRWKWTGIKSWVATHWVRHHWECRVSTQRNDRQDKYDRNKAPQDAPVDFVGQANTQSLIDTERKRLCTMAAKETREQAEDLKCTIHEVQPEIADVLVPNCIYRGGCPEGENNCHWYDHPEQGFLARHPEITPFTTLQERYDIYNKEFYGKHSYTGEIENNKNG